MRVFKHKKAIIALGIIAVLCLALILFVKSPFFKVSLAQTETHLEIGTKPDSNPAAYLQGNDWCIPLSIVDTSEVKHTQMGRYPVYIYHGFQKFTSYINVTDTTAPVVKCEIENLTVVPGATVSVHTLGLKIQDFSEIEKIQFTKISSTKFYTGLPDDVTADMREAYRKGLTMEAEEFQFAYGGIYTLTVSVSDSFFNTSEITLTLKVEEPPVLEVPNDFYVANTVKVDFSEYIDVWDFISEDLDAKDVTIDDSQVNLSKAGTYPVTFSATDDYGLTATKTANVHVSSQNALQEKINTHAVNLSTSVVIGAINPYDSGYYTSEDISKIQSTILPAVVHVENDVLDTFGSGFIIEISDSFVTIATNEHVVFRDITSDITFFDGSRCSGAVVAEDAVRDIAFIRIPIKEIGSETSLSQEYVQTLRTVHINKGYWDKLADDCRLRIGYVCIDIDGDIWKKTSGYIVEKEAIRDWNDYKDVNETIISMAPVGGSSGSAIFDGYGRLVGMIRGYTTYDTYTETVAVPLSEILSYFEIVFKYKIQYQ